MSETLTLIGPSGQTVSVEDSALLVRIKSDFDKAVEDGDAYSWSSLTYDPAEHDTILGVQNDSTTRDLYIERIIASSDTATQFVVHTSSGVTMAGTAVTGVNLNRDSGNVAPATAKTDETGNGQQAASYTGRLIMGQLPTSDFTEINVCGAIVIPGGHMIGVDFTADCSACNVTIVGYFKDR